MNAKRRKSIEASCKLFDLIQQKAASSKNWQELFDVIKDNYNWCWDNNLFTADQIKEIDTDVLISNGFYYDYSGVIENVSCAYIYGGTVQDVRGNATVQNVRDNATVQNVWGNATVQNVWGNGIYRELYKTDKPKLYLKKDAYEIVLID